MKAKISIYFLLLIASFSAYAQSKSGAWKNKKCAVVLTYDDGLNVHLDNVIPLLDSLKFKGTFYVPGNSETLYKRLSDWRNAANEGHEIGNHTLFHGCIRSKGREWVKPYYDLNKYDLQQMIDELNVANTLLYAVDGKNKRSFAYACGDIVVDSTEIFMEKMKDKFVGARTVEQKMQKINEIDVYYIGSFPVVNQSGDELVSWVKKAMDTNSLLVFLFHGVGGEHSLNVSLDAHRKLLKFLKQNEKDIWVAPFIDVCEYIKQYNVQGKGN
jgi:sialate O-acetylesterase